MSDKNEQPAQEWDKNPQSEQQHIAANTIDAAKAADKAAKDGSKPGSKR